MSPTKQDKKSKTKQTINGKYFRSNQKKSTTEVVLFKINQFNF
jgi:hypothetical protein